MTILEILMTSLKTKFAGVEESILSRMAAKLAQTAKDEASAKTAVEGLTIQQLIESYADSRATEAQQTAVKNYEKKWGLKDGSKIENQETQHEQHHEQQQGGEDVPKWAQQLMESNKQLVERVNKYEAEKTTTSRKGELAGIVEKLPESLRKAYEHTSVENLSDEEFTQLKSTIQTEVDGILADTNIKGAVFGRPNVKGGTGNQGSQGGEELSEEQMKAVSQREGMAAKDGQPF